MLTKDAIKHFGGPTNLAARLRRRDGRFGINRQAIYGWGKYPPIGRQHEIEILTDGALRAERGKSVHSPDDQCEPPPEAEAG